MIRLAIIVMLCGLASSSASAKELNWPFIIGEDQRQMVDGTKKPWPAIGRISFAGYNRFGNCTGTLIAPNVVITAAHCLYDRFSKKRIPLKNFHFLAGMTRSDRFLGHGLAACAHLHENFDYNRDYSPEYVNTDAAVVILEKPLDVEPMPLAEDGALKSNSLATHAGYGRDRSFAPSVHANCNVLAVENGIAYTDCDSNFGQSGGPILIEDGGIWKLAAIMSGGDQRFTTGPTVEAWRSLAAKTSCND